jgi:hypothetical protein
MYAISIVSFISNLCVITVNKEPTKGLFPPLLNFFSRTPKCLGSYSRGYAYPKLGNTGVNEDLEKVGTDLYACVPTGIENEETTQNAVVLPALEPNMF